MNFTNHAKQLADKIDEAIAQVKMTTAEMTDRGVATVNELTTTTLQPSLEVIQNASQSISNLTASAVGFTTSSVAIADALKDLPKIADDLARDMPKIAYRLRYRAGVRLGDAPRSDVDVMKLFEKIPGTSKLGASETNIRQFLHSPH